MLKTSTEFITKCDHLELWGNKYVFTSWIVKEKTIDTRNNKIYLPGELCFALISYLDENGCYFFVDETQYFKKA